MSTPDPLFVQSVAKALAVLEAFGAHPGPLSLNELATHADMDRSTVQRMAHTLATLGYLERGPQGKGLMLGKKLLDRSFDFLRCHGLVERATPVVAELQRQTGERVDLSLFDDLTVIYALRRQSKRETFFTTLVGRRVPTYCSAGGRAVLSHLPDAEVDDILARSSMRALTPKTQTDRGLTKLAVAQARELNYALALEQCLLGEIVIGCAVLDHQQRPVGALHIAGSCAEWRSEDFVDRFAPLAIEAARALGR